MSELRERLGELDSADQLADVMAIPEHLSDALWRIESARLTGREAAAVLVCGMGGSAIGADLAMGALGERLTRPMHTIRSYELPSWASSDLSVLCSSYSGNTEETIATYEAAGIVGARRTVATTGGALAERARSDGVPVIGLPGVLQPRAAIAYMFAIAAEVAALAEAAPAIHTEIDDAAARLSERPDALREQAEELGAALHGSIPVVFGADLSAPVARRWKCEINENAKLPAFWSELPEADHNEVVGWSGEAARPLSAVFLEDPDQHPREQRRLQLTAELVRPSASAVLSVRAEGETRTERLLSLVMLGDLLSLCLAARAGVDPTPVAVIERLKDELGRS